MITLELLNNLEKSLKIIDIVTEQDFRNFVKQDKSLIYFLVDWSGPERVSRSFVYKALNELHLKELLIYKIDCSKQEKKYIEEWLVSQGENKTRFYTSGCGEFCLIKNGEIIDFISQPWQLGQNETKNKIIEWVTL